MRGTVSTLLVTVTGTVSYGLANSDAAASPTGFYHSFVLERSQAPAANGKQMHHVIQATMRMRHIEESAPEASVRKRRNYGGR